MDDWISLTRDMTAGAGPGWLAVLGVTLFIALGAGMVLAFDTGRSRNRWRLPVPHTLRGRITLAMVLLATIPAISLALVLSDRASRQRAERVTDALQAQSIGLAGSLATAIDGAAADLGSLAAHIGREADFSPAALERQLRLHHEWAPAMASVMAVRSDATVVAATARVGGTVTLISAGQASASTSSVMAGTVRTGGGAAAVATRDPVLGERATLLLTVPVTTLAGARWGHVTAALDLAATPAAQGWLTRRPPGEVVVADETGRVLLASAGSGFAPLDTLPAALVKRAARPTGEPFDVPAGSSATPSAGFIGVSTAFGPGLRVLLLAPAATFAAARSTELGVVLGWTIGALLVAGWLAVALSASITDPLRALDAAVRGFDPERQPAAPAAPAGTPREVAVVFEQLGSVGERQRVAYDDLQRSLAEGERLRRELISVLEGREAAIHERTQYLKAANEQLDRLSRTDALTGVANRRGLTEFLDRAWRKGMRDQGPVSLLLIDIDHFKAYNDRYGHPQGDRCLQAIANALHHVAGRASDMVARYGGEEFAAVLGDTALEGALQVAEQARSAIERLGIEHRSAPGRIVTVSIGVTSALPVRGTHPEASLEAADQALYAAKEQGRNRVGYSMVSHIALYDPASLPGNPGHRLS